MKLFGIILTAIVSASFLIFGGCLLRKNLNLESTDRDIPLRGGVVFGVTLLTVGTIGVICVAADSRQV